MEYIAFTPGGHPCKKTNCEINQVINEIEKAPPTIKPSLHNPKIICEEYGVQIAQQEGCLFETSPGEIIGVCPRRDCHRRVLITLVPSKQWRG